MAGIPLALRSPAKPTGETWSADVPDAKAGDEYRFVIDGPSGRLSRIDPRARRLTNSVGNSVVFDPGRVRLG